MPKIISVILQHYIMDIHYFSKDFIFNRFNYKDLIIFLIPSIIFMIWLYIYNPGVLGTDSYNQLHQIATNSFNNFHPFFHTFIEMLCLKVYPNPKSIGILQILVFSSVWTIICNYFRHDEEHDEKENLFVLQVIFTAIISLIPINAIFSIMLLKDTLFSYLLLFSCFLIKVLLDKQGNVSFDFIVILSLSLALTSQIRHNGLHLVLIVVACLSFYLFKTINLKKVYLVIPALTIVFILFIASLNVVYDVDDTQKDAVLAKMSHMLADYDLNLDLSNEDRDKVHELFSENDIKKNYNSTYSDDIWRCSNKTAYNSDKFSYIGLAIKYSVLNPVYFIKYMFSSSPMVWVVVWGDDWVGTEYLTDTDWAWGHYYIKRNITPVCGYEMVHTKNKGTPMYEQLNSFVNEGGIKKYHEVSALFNSPALYMYLSFVLMGIIFAFTRSKDIFMVYLPNMINIIIVFLSTPIQDVRYLYPNFLMFYLLVIILMSLLAKPKEQI